MAAAGDRPSREQIERHQVEKLRELLPRLARDNAFYAPRLSWWNGELASVAASGAPVEVASNGS